MPKNTSFSLSERHVEFIHTQVQSGQYGSASEVIRAGLRMLETQEAKLAALRAALIAGENSPALTFSSREELVASIKKRAAELG